MMKNPINPVFLVLLFFRISLKTMAQDTTYPINVGVVLDLDTSFGKIGLSCIKMALSDFYASHAYYSTRLVLHTRDSNGDVVVAAGAALDLINNVKAEAIIGPESSIQSLFIIELGEKAQVPIISFSARSPSLQSSYFIRIAQNDSSQVNAISDIIQAYGWRAIVAVSVDNEFGKGVIPSLITALQAVDARITYWSVIPSTATDDQIIQELIKLSMLDSSIFIVHMLPSLGARFFALANEMSMMKRGFVWIVTSEMADLLTSLNSAVIDNMQGVLGLKTYVPHTEKLEDFRGRWQRRFQQDNPTLLNLKLDVFGLWAYDASWALAMAFEKVVTVNYHFQNINISGSHSGQKRLEVTQSSPKLIKELSGTVFRGLSGVFSLINGQLQSSNFQVVNVNDNGERGVGYWTPQNGLVRNLNSKDPAGRYSNSCAKLGNIIWPGDTTSVPRGWRFPGDGRRLKILVPVKKSFGEFVHVSGSDFSGYCIDVFQAVLNSLAYGVPYAFYPFANSDGESAGTYDDLVYQVFLGNYDAAVGDITIRANRSLYVDFTLPYNESGISMVLPIKNHNDAKSTWIFLKPLTWDLWVTSGCFFIFIGFVVWVLEHRINEDFRGPPHHQIGTSFWFSFSTMVFAHRERVVSNLARFVMIIWCFVVLILTQSYTASFSTILTVQQLRPIITDVNLLMKNGDNVGYHADSFVYGILKELGFQEGKLKKYESIEKLDELLQKGNEKDGISAAFDETPYMKLFAATYCSKYTLVEPTFKSEGFAFVFPKGSVFARDVSRAITSLQEQDDMKAIAEKWFEKLASCSNTKPAGSSNSLTLGVDSFWGLYIIAGVASSLALLIFAAMFLYEHMHTLTSFDPETSFWSRICLLWRVYDQRDPASHTSTHHKRQLQHSGVDIIGAVEASPNSNSPPRPSSASNMESHLVVEELGTLPTEIEHRSGRATPEVECAINLTPPSEARH